MVTRESFKPKAYHQNGNAVELIDHTLNDGTTVTELRINDGACDPLMDTSLSESEQRRQAEYTVGAGTATRSAGEYSVNANYAGNKNVDYMSSSGVVPALGASRKALGECHLT